MCHAPHSGSLGNGKATTADPQNGMYALWGQDLTPLFGQTYNFSGDGAAKYPVTLPASGTITSAHDANTVILFCLSCHDGVLTSVGMMQGHTVETLPIVGGTAPTLLAKAAPTAGAAYNNDHPVGGQAVVGCGGQYNWDCTGGGATATPIAMTGPNGTRSCSELPGFLLDRRGNPLATFRDHGKRGHLHHLSRSAQHDRLRQQERQLPNDVLHSRPVHSVCRRQRGSAILPQLPWWRVERIARIDERADRLVCLLCWGREGSSPFFLERGSHEIPILNPRGAGSSAHNIGDGSGCLSRSGTAAKGRE